MYSTSLTMVGQDLHESIKNLLQFQPPLNKINELVDLSKHIIDNDNYSRHGPWPNVLILVTTNQEDIDIVQSCFF